MTVPRVPAFLEFTVQRALIQQPHGNSALQATWQSPGSRGDHHPAPGLHSPRWWWTRGAQRSGVLP